MPTDRFDATTLWWRHEQLHRAVLADPERLLAMLAPEQARVEARWLTEPPDPAAAFAEADEVETRWLELVREAGGPDRRTRRARRYWDTRNARAGMPEVPTSPVT